MICASVCLLLLIFLPLSFVQIVFQFGRIQGVRSKSDTRLLSSSFVHDIRRSHQQSQALFLRGMESGIDTAQSDRAAR
jgi:hypothetical protein